MAVVLGDLYLDHIPCKAIATSEYEQGNKRRGDGDRPASASLRNGWDVSVRPPVTITGTAAPSCSIHALS